MANTDKLLESLAKLVPVGVAIAIVAFIYLVILFKRVSERFIELNQKQAEFLKDRVDVIDKTSVVFTRTIDQQEKEIRKLRTELDSVNVALTQTRSTLTDRSIEEVKAIGDVVQQVLKLQAATLEVVTVRQGGGSIEAHQTALLERNIAITQSLDVEIPKLVERRDFSRYRVMVTKMKGADQLVIDLSSLGLSVSVYERPFGNQEGERYDINQQESIWIGKHVPPEIAIPAIAVALRNWPFLKYIHISGDRGDSAPPSEYDSLYFGGSTHTATKHFGLTPWKPTEIGQLSATTISDFHDTLRSHYGAEVG